MAYAVALGMVTVMVPLFAVHSGYGIGAVGLLVSVSAVTQAVVRLGLGALMDRFSTRFLIITSCLMLMSCGLILGLADALWTFIAAQLMQGISRAYFWTATQTHVIRSSDTAVSAIATMNIINGVGSMVGPFIAGLIGGVSLRLVFLIAAMIAAGSIVPAMMLTRFPPFHRDRPTGAPATTLGRHLRPGVMAAAIMSAGGGAWRGALDSYIPVILTAAGLSVSLTGTLIAVANFATMVGSAASKFAKPLGDRACVVLGTAPAGLGLAAVALLPVSPSAVALFLFISGVGAGLLQTIGPAMASDSVTDGERGRAIATNGVFRSFAMLLTPLSIGGLMLLLPSVGWSTAVLGVGMVTPAVLTARRHQPRSDA
nr:MFS transporter [Microbacterium sp. SYP-A9085]